MRHGIASLFTLILISSPVVAYGQTVTAMWDPSPPSDEVTSYQVCIGTTSMSCNVQLASVSEPQTTYTFTPTPGVVHYVAIRAINSVGTGPYSTETSFSIPSFIQPVNQSSPAGVAITPLNMSVTDPDGSGRNFTHTGLPTGLALNATTGQITGTPSAAGTYNVTIFVTDSLVTVSRSFVWTITALVADTTAPALTITSHTNEQTLSTASVTIFGTASDSGRGGNGVSSVTVNGQAATGGSATGSATASWSRKLTLAQGANTITVQATDSRGNIATQSITLNNSSAPVTSVALTSTVASPQNTGTAITFIANSSGGVAPHQFKFLVQPAGGAAQVVQDWSAATTYTWTPATTGAYTVILWARSAGVTAEDPVPASPEDTFSRANWPNLGPNWTCLTANEPIIENGFARSSLDEHYFCKWNAHTMAADHCAAFKVGNATYGNGVFVRGSGAGATRDAYRFSAGSPGHNSFFIKEVDDAVTAVLAPPTLMNWIPGDEGRVCATGTSTVTITLERKSVGSPNWVQINSVEDSSSPLSGTDVGLYIYGTDATIDDLIFTNVAPAEPSASANVDAPQASAQMAYVVNTLASAPVTSATLTSTAASPQNSGTAITFTATSSGGVAPHEYKFFLSQGGGAAQGVREWGTSPTYTWTPPTAGTYTMIVWARSAGVTVEAAQASAQMAYVVNTPPPASVTSVALTSTAASPQNSGTAITFTATSSGGVAPHEYKFFLSQGGGAAQGVREWGTSPTYTWTPPTAGTYTMIVWARSAGVTVEAAQASAQMAYVVNTPPAAPVTSATLTSTAASPQNAGTAITFTANSSGGVAPHQYKFLLSQGGGAAQGVREWGTSPTYTWTPPTAGTYTMIVWARSAGVTVEAAQASAQMAYVVNTPPAAPVTSATLTSTAASPQNAGTAITFTANSSGGVAPHQYKFLLSQGGGAAQGVRDWSTATTYTWTPPTAGTYTMIVWARSAGVTADAAQASAQMAYVVNTPPAAPVTSATLTSTAASPQNAGTAITFTANSSGGVAPHQYKFLLSQGGGAAQGVRDWSTATTYTWTPPTAGTYTMIVWARSAGVTVDAAQASAQMAYMINTPPPAPVTSVALTPNQASPQGTGTPVTFSAAASGGVGPQQYKFLLQSTGGAARVVQNWGTATTYTWTPAATGDHTVTVWARSAGVTVDAAQASAQVPYSVIAGGVNAVSVLPSSGSGSAQTFTLAYSDSRGASNLISEWVWISGGTATCMVYHERATNRVYLLNDAGTAWTSKMLGSSSILQGSSCAINLGSSSASASGSVLTLNLAIAFTPAFSGEKTIRMFANAAGGLSSGWQDRGSWTVPGSAPAPTDSRKRRKTSTATTTTTTLAPEPTPTIQSGVQALSVTPASGSGSSATFVMRYADSRGARNLVAEWVRFSGGTGMCMIYHERVTNTVYLINDAGSAWHTGLIRSATTLQNGSCAVNLGNSSVSIDGPVLTLNLAISFKAPFTGTKNISMFASALGNLSTGWQNRGTWIVP